MRATSAFRSSLIALLSLIGVTFAFPAYADSGGISLRVFKAGFVIGGSAGSGTLSFHGRRYPLDIGGLSYGFTFGASETHFRGAVTHIRRPSDVIGVYAGTLYYVVERPLVDGPRACEERSLSPESEPGQRCERLIGLDDRAEVVEGMHRLSFPHPRPRASAAHRRVRETGPAP